MEHINVATPLKVFAYCRVSTNERQQRFDIQESAIKQYVAIRNMEIIEWFQDTASAIKMSKRTQWTALLEVIQKSKVKPHAIVAYRLDRVARSVRDYVHITEELEKYGVQLYTTDFDTYGLNQAYVSFMKTLLIAFAQLDREIIVSRVKDGLEEAKARGVILGRPSVIAQLDDELPSIRRMLRANMTFKQIAKALDVSQSSLRRYLRKFEG